MLLKIFGGFWAEAMLSDEKWNKYIDIIELKLRVAGKTKGKWLLYFSKMKSLHMMWNHLNLDRYFRSWILNQYMCYIYFSIFML